MTDVSLPAGPPTLRSPVLVASFAGWNDAGDAASAAVEQLATAWDAQPLAEIDPESYVDFQVTRPIVSVTEDGERQISWPVTKLSYCLLPTEPFDIVLLRGIEPNFRWRAFCDEILAAVRPLGIDTVVGLGALLADVPHTRPIQVSGSGGDAVTRERFGLVASTYEGPTGIAGVFAEFCSRAGLPTASLWATVPHYVSQAPSPKATLALLHRLEELLDIEVPLGELPEAADAWELEVSQIAADDEEISEYIHALEQRDEQDEPMRPASGESIAAEFERYLRRRGPKPR